MTFCVVAGIVGGAIGYYIALAWTTAAIVYFEVGVAYFCIHLHIAWKEKITRIMVGTNCSGNAWAKFYNSCANQQHEST